jgi:cyclopropane-fatty-acyl-phospholipid synthase
MLNSSALTIDHASLTSVQKMARTFILKQLVNLQHGQLTVRETFAAAETPEHNFGDGSSGLHCSVEIHNPQFYAAMLRGGSIAAAEAYMDGWWDSSNLTTVLQIMALNLSTLDTMESRNSLLNKFKNQIGHWFNRNTQQNSKKNIHAHYDLGNQLYTRFLDPNMLYSAAIFEHPQQSLTDAQINKMDRLCQQLELQAGDHVLEIGTGWGAMAIYMAQQYGCKVTTTTISEEQFAYTEQRVKALGLEDKITLLMQDYRDLDGEYDKLVSIEMIEAVGKSFLTSYVQQCQQRVKSGGLVAIQAITIADQRFESYSKSVDFIQKYIFPGGFLPSVTYLLEHTTRYTNLVVQDLQDIGLDYALTLEHWRKQFNAVSDELESLGYDERFQRMWNYYFCYCEGGFLARSISTVQLTFRKTV